MKVFAVLALMLGLCVVTLIVGHYGFAAVGSTLLLVGWTGFLAILLIHIGVMVLFGICWWILLPPSARPSPWVFVWSRFVRDGGSEALPLSQVAGYVLGARAAILAGLAAPMAIASTVVDVTMELLAQLAYTALGVALLSALRPRTGFTTPVLISLAAALAISILFIAAQQRGFGLLERLAHRLARRWADAAATGAAAIQAAIGAIYRRRGGLLAGFALHLLCWILGAVEPWLALRWMGAPLEFEAVLAIESLLYAVRSVGFAIPDALGIQEGAYILLCGLFGIGPEVALSLSLLKRARDLSLGVPALLAWQLMETGRAWRRRATPVEQAGDPLRPPARP